MQRCSTLLMKHTQKLTGYKGTYDPLKSAKGRNRNSRLIFFYVCLGYLIFENIYSFIPIGEKTINNYNSWTQWFLILKSAVFPCKISCGYEDLEQNEVKRIKKKEKKNKKSPLSWSNGESGGLNTSVPSGRPWINSVTCLNRDRRCEKRTAVKILCAFDFFFHTKTV